jgi:hypothetical protein
MAAAASRRTGSEPAAVTGPGTARLADPQRQPGRVRDADLPGVAQGKRGEMAEPHLASGEAADGPFPREHRSTARPAS